MSYMRDRGLVDLSDVIMESPFTKEIVMCPNNRKLKPPLIDLYDRIKDPVDHVWTF